jgi:hypothetical protein
MIAHGWSNLQPSWLPERSRGEERGSGAPPAGAGITLDPVRDRELMAECEHRLGRYGPLPEHPKLYATSVVEVARRRLAGAPA